MNEDFISDVWSMFKEYIDKKHIELAAEKYVDMIIDYGVDDLQLKEMLGIDKHLDAAIQYCLEIDSVDNDDDDLEWE